MADPVLELRRGGGGLLALSAFLFHSVISPVLPKIRGTWPLPAQDLQYCIYWLLPFLWEKLSHRWEKSKEDKPKMFCRGRKKWFNTIVQFTNLSEFLCFIRYLRSAILRSACSAGDTDCIGTATKIFNEWRTGNRWTLLFHSFFYIHETVIPDKENSVEVERLL